MCPLWHSVMQAGRDTIKEITKGVFNVGKDYSGVFTLDDIPVIEQRINAAIDIFCTDHEIESMKKEVQNVWNGCLMFIRRTVFPVRDLLLDPELRPTGVTISTSNRFNYILLFQISEIYKTLCFIYDKECSLYGFSLLTGVYIDTIKEWLTGELSPDAYLVAKNLQIGQQETLQARLHSVKNPVGVLAILNHYHHWNQIGEEETVRPAALAASALPRLSSQIVTQLAEKGNDRDQSASQNEPENSK